VKYFVLSGRRRLPLQLGQMGPKGHIPSPPRKTLINPLVFVNKKPIDDGVTAHRQPTASQEPASYFVIGQNGWIDGWMDRWMDGQQTWEAPSNQTEIASQ